MAKKKSSSSRKPSQAFDLDFSIEEDALLRGLMESKGKRIEVIAFGIVYSGILENVDVDGGQIVIADGDDRAVIEIERIESLTPLESML